MDNPSPQARETRVRYPRPSQRPARGAGLRHAASVLLAVALALGDAGELPGGAAATPATVALTFLAEADADVVRDRPAANDGDAGSLVVDAEPLTEAYLRFAVADVAGTVQDARLRLYVVDASTNGPAVYGASASWGEADITWDTRPARTTPAIEDKGVVGAGAWVEYDVTALVAGDGIYSFALLPTSRDGTDFASREASTTDVRPQLVLTVAGGEVTPPADVTPPTVSLSGPASSTTFTAAQVVALAATAADDTGVAKVEFYDNGAWRGTEDTAPFVHAWAITSADNGTHSWTAKAFDAAGNTAASAPVALTVNIAPTPTPTPTPAPGGAITAAGETTPVRSGGDAADDPAIWVHPTDPALSLIFGTDKATGGLAVYDLAGREIAWYAVGRPNNVDVRQGVSLGGAVRDIVALSEKDSDDILVFEVDPATRRLTDLTGSTATGLGVDGFCLYASPAGPLYGFVSNTSGTTEQHELRWNAATGKLDSRVVRRLAIPGTGEGAEGCVADDEHRALFIAPDLLGIYRYDAEPTGSTAPVIVDRVGAGRLVADVEGLALYRTPGGGGYLIASVQGSDSYVVYDRQAPHTPRLQFKIGAGVVDGTSHTDGIEVISTGLGPAFPEGAFVAQDDRNDGGNQNFKLVPWGRIARSASPQLTVNGGSSP